jgi:hypothetical protein
MARDSPILDGIFEASSNMSNRLPVPSPSNPERIEVKQLTFAIRGVPHFWLPSPFVQQRSFAKFPILAILVLESRTEGFRELALFKLLE